MMSKIAHLPESMGHQRADPGVHLSQQLDVRGMDAYIMCRGQRPVACRYQFASGLFIGQGQLACC
jgi:hypothetical protein